MKNNYKINENLAWREVQGQILILDAQFTESAHELNPMASYIFGLINDGKQTGEIKSLLCQEYADEVTNETIQADLTQYLNELREKKIIEVL